MTNATIQTTKGKIKEIKVGIWNKPICLYCNSPLDDPKNSANFIGSVCPECNGILRLHNMALPDLLTPVV